MSEKENIKNLFTNSRSRLNIILVTGLVIIMILIGYFMLHKKSTTVAETGPSIGNIGTVNTKNIPGTSESETYNKNIAESNTKAAQEADKANSSYLPTLVNPNVKGVDATPPPVKPIEDPKIQPTVQVLDTHTPAPLNTSPSTATVLDNTPRQRVIDRKALRKQQEAVIAAEEAMARQAELQRQEEARKKAYLKQLSIYVGEWTPNGQYIENAYKDPVLSPKEDTATNASGTNATTATAVQKEVVAVAGSFIPSVLLSAINTDYQGPVVAKIVQGALKDAVVTGEIVVGPDGALLKFSKISFADGTSAKVNAYAVDSQAYSYKMATDVNNHYLTNFASLFGGAFLQGYGQAEQSAGQTTTVDPTTGTVTSSTSQLNASDINKKAVGNVANVAGGALIKNSQRIPTITVDVGTSFSILLVDNLAI